MKFIVRTSSTNEFSEGCEYALIDMTPLLAVHILFQKGAFDMIALNNSDLTELVFHSNDAEYFSTFPDDVQDEPRWDASELEGLADNEGFTPAPEGFAVEVERTECDRMEIGKHGISFRAYPKHCDWMVTTHEIDYATIEQAARVEVAA